MDNPQRILISFNYKWTEKGTNFSHVCAKQCCFVGKLKSNTKPPWSLSGNCLRNIWFLRYEFSWICRSDLTTEEVLWEFNCCGIAGEIIPFIHLLPELFLFVRLQYFLTFSLPNSFLKNHQKFSTCTATQFTQHVVFIPYFENGRKLVRKGLKYVNQWGK